MRRICSGTFAAADFGSGMACLLDSDQLAVDAPRPPEEVGDLADGGIGRDGLDDRREQVALALRLVLQPAHRRGPGDAIAAGADRAQALDLATLALRVDAQDRRPRAGLLVREAVDAHDDAIAALDLALDAVCRLLDLAL